MEEDILKYGNRDDLYKFLIEDFGFVKLEERYDSKAFGNFLVILSANEFLLRYIRNRSDLTIEIASHSDPSKWADLSFVKNFIYYPENLNTDESSKGISRRIDELNSFLRKDFDLIGDLFNKENYKNTQEKIDELLRQQFDQRFPGSIQ